MNSLSFFFSFVRYTHCYVKKRKALDNPNNALIHFSQFLSFFLLKWQSKRALRMEVLCKRYTHKVTKRILSLHTHAHKIKKIKFVLVFFSLLIKLQRTYFRQKFRSIFSMFCFCNAKKEHTEKKLDEKNDKVHDINSRWPNVE